MEKLKKANPETLKLLVEFPRLMSSSEIDALDTTIETLIVQRNRLKFDKTLTKEQLLSLYHGYGYYPKTGDKFWKIKGIGKSRGLYGWQVGQFEHACHVDTTNLIVLYVIDPGTPKYPNTSQYTIEISDMWLEGPIII